MYHSLTIGDRNTYDDWHLVPKTRPVVSPAQPKLVYDDIPGGNGSLDLSEAVTGSVTYNDRTGSFDFLVLNDYGEWQDRYSEILNYLQGRKFRLVLEDDPDYYYYGRFAVNEWKSQKNWSEITIDYRVGPFKYKRLQSTYIAPVPTASYISIPGLLIPAVPIIYCTGKVTVTKGARSYTFEPGVPREVIQFQPGEALRFAPEVTGTGPAEHKTLLPAVYLDELQGNPYTHNGVRYNLVYPDSGTVALSGTSTNISWYSLSGTYVTDVIPPVELDPAQPHLLSGCPSGGSSTTYAIRCRLYKPGKTPGVDTMDRMVVHYGGDPVEIPAGYAYAEIYISIQNGVNTDGLIFRPMFVEGTVQQPYDTARCDCTKAIIKYNGGSL